METTNTSYENLEKLFLFMLTASSFKEKPNSLCYSDLYKHIVFNIINGVYSKNNPTEYKVKTIFIKLNPNVDETELREVATLLTNKGFKMSYENMASEGNLFLLEIELPEV